jgi:hypothetical protein
MNGDTPTRRDSADVGETRVGLAAGRRVFGRYTLKRLVGRGGMGVVWLADDDVLGEPVALKFLPEAIAQDEVAVDEMKTETRRARRLTHPHIVRIHDFVQDERMAAVSMEFVDGSTLGQLRLAQPGKVFAPATLGPLVAQLCAALEYAHGEAKIAHRDLKPANVLVTREGQVRITDFGIARSLTETHTRLTGRVGDTSGTMLYMSPQQLAGDKPSSADDIYALGVTLYELLTGKPPFHRGDGLSLMKQIRERAPAPLAEQRAELAGGSVSPIALPAIPPAWEETILACLAKDPQDRPKSAGEVARRLNLTTDLTAEKMAGAAAPAALPAKIPGRRSKLPLLAAAAAVVALGAAGYLFWPKNRPQGGSANLGPAPVSAPASSGAAAGAAAPAVPALLPREFTVTVDPADAGARVWLGPLADVEVKEGRAVLKDLPDGVQDLVVQAPGYQAFTMRVTVKDGRGSADAKLVAVHAAVAVTARPGTEVIAVDERGRETRLGTVPVDGMLASDNLLTVGTYTMRLEHADCATVTVPDIELVLGRTVKVAPVQTPLPGELRVFSVPTGAEVRVNGQAAGQTPATIKSQPSEQALRLEVFLRGYRRVEQEVTLKPKEVRTLNVGTLTAESGSVELRLTNAGVRMADLAIRIDGGSVNIGEALAGAPLRVDSLEVGSRMVEIVHPDYEPWRQAVTVRNQETTAVDVELKPKLGTVACETTPAGARVVINGGDRHEATFIDSRTKAERLTPLQDVLPPGEYTLRFELKGYKAATRTVTVTASRTVQVSALLERQAYAEPSKTWENTLGMRFVSVPRTRVWFCIWVTRVQDFAAFVRETGYDATKGMFSFGSDGWKPRGNSWRSPGFSQGLTHPVCGVNWEDAKAFCRWLTAKERREGRLGPNDEYRLPTDAEWSMAVGLDEPSGGTPESKNGRIRGVYPWGTQWPPPRGAGNFAGTEVRTSYWPSQMMVIEGYSDGYPRTSPVGSFAANRYGLYDMSGNVWQWCEDFYNGSNGRRVLRGGSFTTGVSGNLLSSFRNTVAPNLRVVFCGFRCVLARSAP